MNDERVTLVDSWAPSYGRVVYIETLHIPPEVDISVPRYWLRQHGHIRKPNVKAIRQGHYRQIARAGAG